MDIEYRNQISPEAYNEMRRSVGWKLLPEKQASKGLANTYRIIAAEISGEMAGMLRIISDGGYMALIADVMVHPKFQRRGIGAALMEKAMAFIREDLAEEARNMVMVNLMAVQGKERFYERFGFVERPNTADGAGMHCWINRT